MKKFISILFALVLVLTMSLVTAVPVGADPADGDVTIIVQDQAEDPIEGATVYLWFFGGGKGGYFQPFKTTDASGSATFLATDIATWLTDTGYDYTLGTIYCQPNPVATKNGFVGKVRTVSQANGYPIIQYQNTTGQFSPAMTFTYSMIFASAEHMQMLWNQPEGKYTVSYNLQQPLASAPNANRIAIIRSPLKTEETNPDLTFYMMNKDTGVQEVYYQIDQADATISSGTHVSAVFDQATWTTNVEPNDKVAAYSYVDYHGAPSCPSIGSVIKGDAMDEYYFCYINESEGYSILQQEGTSVGMKATSEAAVIGISVNPSAIDFGAITSGVTRGGPSLTVSNIGNVGVSVSGEITADTFYDTDNTLYFYTAALKLNEKLSDKSGTPTALGGKWLATDLGLGSVAVGQSGGVSTKVVCPSPVKVATTYTGTVVFWAEETP